MSLENSRSVEKLFIYIILLKHTRVKIPLYTLPLLLNIDFPVSLWGPQNVWIYSHRSLKFRCSQRSRGRRAQDAPVVLETARRLISDVALSRASLLHLVGRGGSEEDGRIKHV